MKYRENVKCPESSNNDWMHWETIGEYSIWCRLDFPCYTIWQATKGEKPSQTSGGYYRKEYLLEAKNINH